MTVNEKLCKNIALNLQATCFGYLLELPRRGDSNKYPKYMLFEEIRIKRDFSYILFIKDSLQEQFIFATFSGTNVVMRVR